MIDTETKDALQSVMDRANELGLHGVMILSPACPDCGFCHDYKLISDIPDQADVSNLLAHFASISELDPDLVEIIEVRLQ